MLDVTRWFRPPSTESLIQAINGDRARLAAARWAASLGLFSREIERYPAETTAPQFQNEHTAAHTRAAAQQPDMFKR